MRHHHTQTRKPFQRYAKLSHCIWKVSAAWEGTDGAQEDDQPFEVRLSDESFETYELDPPPYTLDTTKAELKQMYYDMVAVRYEHLCAKPMPAGGF
jgi:hypothetical protein